jgi:hypothetical protein
VVGHRSGKDIRTCVCVSVCGLNLGTAPVEPRQRRAACGNVARLLRNVPWKKSIAGSGTTAAIPCSVAFGICGTGGVGPIQSDPTSHVWLPGNHLRAWEARRRASEGCSTRGGMWRSADLRKSFADQRRSDSSRRRSCGARGSVGAGGFISVDYRCYHTLLRPLSSSRPLGLVDTEIWKFQSVARQWIVTICKIRSSSPISSSSIRISNKQVQSA